MGGSGTFPLADDAYVIVVSGEDSATPANETEHTFAFDLDDTPPEFGALDRVPSGSASTDASSIVQTIGGSITDVQNAG